MGKKQVPEDIIKKLHEEYLKDFNGNNKIARRDRKDKKKQRNRIRNLAAAKEKIKARREHKRLKRRGRDINKELRRRSGLQKL